MRRPRIPVIWRFLLDPDRVSVKQMAYINVSSRPILFLLDVHLATSHGAPHDSSGAVRGKEHLSSLQDRRLPAIVPSYEEVYATKALDPVLFKRSKTSDL